MVIFYCSVINELFSFFLSWVDLKQGCTWQTITNLLLKYKNLMPAYMAVIV
jgi:hypothetical protein